MSRLDKMMIAYVFLALFVSNMVSYNRGVKTGLDQAAGITVQNYGMRMYSFVYNRGEMKTYLDNKLVNTQHPINFTISFWTDSVVEAVRNGRKNSI